MPLSIVGAGFSRTGTLSLKRAIEQLDLGPCWHVLDCTSAASTAQVLSCFDTYPSVNWDQVFDGFNAAVDAPVSPFYRDIAEWYSSAKVILTVREPSAWFRSAEVLLRLWHAQRANTSKESRGIYDKYLSGAFGAVPALFYQFRDRESVIAAYERHNAEVQSSISAHRLLVFDVKQGWDPLCRFLRVPIPDTSFPWANSSSELIARFEQSASDRPEGLDVP